MMLGFYLIVETSIYNFMNHEETEKCNKPKEHVRTRVSTLEACFHTQHHQLQFLAPAKMFQESLKRLRLKILCRHSGNGQRTKYVSMLA